MSDNGKKIGLNPADDAIWKGVGHPVTLDEALSRLTKEELSRVRAAFGISGVSSLGKTALRQALAERIPERLPSLLSVIDQERCDVLRQAARRGGCAAIELDGLQLHYFRNRGLLFPSVVNGQKRLVMPQETLAAFNAVDKPSYRQAMRRHSSWIRLAQGALYYYGALPEGELMRRLAQLTNEPVDSAACLAVLRESRPYWGGLQVVRKAVAHADVMDIGSVLSEHDARPELPFYPVTEQLALRASDPEYIEWSPPFKAFVDYLADNYEIDRDEAVDMIDMLAYNIKLGDSLSELIEHLQDELEFPDEESIKAIVDLTVQLNNHTRQWALKGYSPVELRQAARPGGRVEAGKPGAQVYRHDTGRKVGRNEPCPCGSGKKFKTCCGA